MLALSSYFVFDIFSRIMKQCFQILPILLLSMYSSLKKSWDSLSPTFPASVTAAEQKKQNSSF